MNRGVTFTGLEVAYVVSALLRQIDFECSRKWDLENFELMPDCLRDLERELACLEKAVAATRDELAADTLSQIDGYIERADRTITLLRECIDGTRSIYHLPRRNRS